MALPLLPETEILGILSQLEIIGEKPLSVFSSEHATNNGAETFHKTLKSVVKVHHPNAW